MNKILTLTLSAVTLCSLNIAQSLAQVNYAEKKTKNQQQTTSASMRGCRRNLPKLQLLAPADQIAVMGERQTFLLNLSALPPYPLKLSILEPYVPEALWQKELKVEAPGILKVSIPNNINLDPDKEYIFTATIPCNPDYPSSSSYVRVLFEKSPFEYEEKQPVEKVSRLVAAGIWYDALLIAYENKLPEFKQLLEKQGIEME